MFLKRNPIPESSLGYPILQLLGRRVRRQEEVELVDLGLNRGQQLTETLRIIRLRPLHGLSLHRLYLLLLRLLLLLLLLLLQRLLPALLEEAHPLHQILGQLRELHMRRLVLVARRVARVEQLPEATHQLGVLGLLLVIEVWQLLHLVGPNEVGVLLLLLRRHHGLTRLALGPIHGDGRGMEG